jgi:anti-sigma regulatory factor (Ser/Thr protein kinase)
MTAARSRDIAGQPESVAAARAWVAGFLPGSPAVGDAAAETPAAGTFKPCCDYDPMFKLHGCELEAGHEGPHIDCLGSEWDEHLDPQPDRCGSHAPWGSGWPDQRCVHGTGHDERHRDRSGSEWDEPLTRAEDRAPGGCLDADTCTCAFPGLPESVSAARSWVAGFFPDPATAADAALMTSELVTNAIKYTACCLPGGEVLVSVRADGTGTRVDVVDQGPVYPCFPVPGSLGLGLGLVLVRQLADACGSDGGDKWFALRTGGVS